MWDPHGDPHGEAARPGATCAAAERRVDYRSYVWDYRCLGGGLPKLCVATIFLLSCSTTRQFMPYNGKINLLAGQYADAALMNATNKGTRKKTEAKNQNFDSTRALAEAANSRVNNHLGWTKQGWANLKVNLEAKEKRRHEDSLVFGIVSALLFLSFVTLLVLTVYQVWPSNVLGWCWLAWVVFFLSSLFVLFNT